MATSANLTDVAAYRDYVQDFGDQLISKAFYSPKTIDMATTHEGVKGKKTLTLLDIVGELAVAWKSDFEKKDNVAKFSPRHLEVEACKIDLSFCPQDFEDTYLGMFRKKGQNPGEDMPFQGFVLDKIMGKHAIDIDNALWKAVRAGSVTPGVTPMSQTFNGFKKIIADLITAGHAVIPTPGGAVTLTNIIDLVETMWESLSDAYKEMPVAVFMSWKNYQRYNQAYRDQFGKYVSDNKSGAVTLDFGQNAQLIPMPGLAGSDRIIMTPAYNLHVGYDDMTGDNMFEFEKNKRNIDFWLDFKIGCQIGLTDDDVLVVNDLA